LVKEKEVLGLPVISFLFRRVLNWRSSFKESGHWGYFEKLKVSGDKVKHSLTNLSKLHFSLLEVTEYMENRIRMVFFILQKLDRGRERFSFPVLKSFSVFPGNFPFLFGSRQANRFDHGHLQIRCRR